MEHRPSDNIRWKALGLDLLHNAAVALVAAATVVLAMFLLPPVGEIVEWIIFPFYGTGGGRFVVFYHTMHFAILAAAAFVLARKRASWGLRLLRRHETAQKLADGRAYRFTRTLGVPILLLVVNELIFCALMDDCLTRTILR